MRKKADRKIILEDGQEYYGYAFGAGDEKMLEIVFNTSMVGYQEILSDPSYTDQAVVMTYPLIGNYGITDEDFEARTPKIGGLVVRECCDTPSNFRYTQTLEEHLEEHGIPCLSGVDTRMLTKVIRDCGRPMAAIGRPSSRMTLVRRRVSMSLRQGIPWSSSSSSRVLVIRKLLGVSQHSRTTIPPMFGNLDSKSSSVMP